ncbi:MAG: hypothetical protein KC502_03085 [Myxococcales bacterium]|nr:hypothetical protein [Myxococcales bacterium]
MSERRAPLVWLAVALGLAGVAASAWSPYSFLKGDSAFYATMERALLDTGWLEMSDHHPMSWYKGGLPHYRNMDQAWSNLSLGADGVSYYPKHPWLIAVFALPFYALFGAGGVLAFNVLAAATIVAMGYIIARKYAGPQVALAATIPVVLSGLMLENTYTFSNDIFYTALLGVGVATLIARHFALSAFFLACAVVAKPTNLLWLPLPFVAIAWGVLEQWRGGNHRSLFPPLSDLVAPMVRPALAAGAVLLVAAGMNTVMFGSPLRSGYHSIVIAKGGQISVDSAAAAFNQPFWAGLADQVTNHWQGLWPRGMVLAAGAIIGVFGLRRIGPAALLPLLVFGTYLLVHAKYDYVWARFYLPCLLLSPLGLAAPFAKVPAAPTTTMETRRIGRLIAIVIVAWVLCVGVGVLRKGPGAQHDLAAHITSARVTRTTGGRTVPCDYLNPNTMHWECSRLEGQYWEGWGADIRRQCNFSRWAGQAPAGLKAKDVRGMLYMQPAPVGTTKRMVLPDLGPLSELSLLLGYAKSARGLDANITVRLNGKTLSLPKASRAGTLHLVALGDKAKSDGPNRLEIEVHAAAHHDWRQLCIGALMSR